MRLLLPLILTQGSMMLEAARQITSQARIPPKLKGVIFDMDGTLTVPNLDFERMYARCGVPITEDILLAISAMPIDKKTAANLVIEEMEEEGRRTLKLAPGVIEMAVWLESHKVPCAMVTRNTRATTDVFFKNIWTAAGLNPFPIVVSRDMSLPPKPDPTSLAYIAGKWGVSLPSDELVMVGDSPSNDIGFGKAAGVTTALVDSGRSHLEEGKFVSEGGGGADICVQSLALLPRQLWLRYHIDGPLGSGVPLLKYETPVPSGGASIAAATGDLATLSTMLFDELNKQDVTGNTPLIWAADAGHLSCVEKLLAMRVSLDTRGYLGSTACTRASRKGNIAVLRALCIAGANSDMPNDKMQYPLHFAAFKKHPEAVDVLLAHGANPLVLDRKGRTPSEDTSDESIKNVLRASMQKLFDRNDFRLLDPK